MVDAQNKKGNSIRNALAVLARPRSCCKFVGAQNVLGPEISRAQTVDAGEEPWHAIRRNGAEVGFRGMTLRYQGLRQCRPDVPAHGVISRHGFVGAFENNYVALANERLDD